MQHGVQQRVVMRRGAIARQYMTRGPFAVDALSSVAWFAQVWGALFLEGAGAVAGFCSTR